MSDASTTAGKDYKDTVNLPKTEFPMKGNLAQLEPKMLAWWDEQKTYERMIEQNAKNDAFILHDGPPYANGHLHAGHALNKILKDIVVKHRNMSGLRCEFIPGWDCHGLPIEQAVEKRLKDKKIDKRTLGREEFLEKCRAYALEFIDIQRGEFQRMGVFGKWTEPYRTLDFSYEAQEIRELSTFADRGFLYRKKKPVYWCLTDATALAEAEVEYDQLKLPSTYIAMEANADVAQKLPALAGKKVAYLIWTTTPWTIPANLGISVHPEFEYVFYALGERVICVAKDLLAKVLAEIAPDEIVLKNVALPGGEVSAPSLVDASRIVAYATGADLEHLTYRHPLIERTCKLMVGEHVTLDAGTGLVHTAPGHGPDDYLIGLRYGLEAYNPVKNDGKYDDTVGPELAGKSVHVANPLVIELLVQKGALLSNPKASTETSYPHCWRCHNPVIYRATHQWFISMEHQNFRQAALEGVDRVNWVPRWGRERIRGMLENRPDWCISRQRTWGVPIPVALCNECDHAHVSGALMKQVADVVAQKGAAVWYETPIAEFLPSTDFACPQCGKRDWRRETDILDVWFDSACSFAAVAEKRLGASPDRPADLYLEGSDQHRGWFHSSLLVGVGTRDEVPYRSCLTHGFVVDGEGKKMSKSVGNTVSPDQMIKGYGAEVMRLWVASSDYRDDVRLSDQILKGLSEGYRKIRNTLRYTLSNLFDFDPAKDAVPKSELLPLDKWARARLADVVARVGKAYDAYEFHLVFQTVVDFCATDLSAIYFDILKDRLYTSRANGQARRSAQTVLHEVATQLLGLLAPVMSFTADEAWQFLPGDKAPSVFLAGFPRAAADAADAEVVKKYERLFALRSAVQQLLEVERREKRIGSSLEAKVVLHANPEAREYLSRYAAELPGLMIVSQVELAEGTQGQALPLTQSWGEGTAIFAKIEAAEGTKCPRCWTYSTQVGTAGHEVCAKCEEALA